MRASRRPRANAATPSVDSGTGSVINNERESVATESQSGVANVPISSARVSMQRHLARPTLGAWKINQTVLLLVIGLAIVGISVIIGQRFGWPVAVMTWWPAAILIWALIWLIRALLRYSANGWLASCALLGLAISLLLTTAYGMSFSSLWLGVGLITLGAGTLLRGLLWGAR